mmetsp:Transcript_14347/g.38439  ORF Transcript_14347/g.38439 Transcript_14347/m.38439 type:complete len:543 (+) Transcript_14347:41-1669(+)
MGRGADGEAVDFGMEKTEVMMQGFDWTSCHHNGGWYRRLIELAPAIEDLGVTVVWFPPPQDSLAPQGYMPRDIDKLDSKYGSEGDLKEAVATFKKRGLLCLVDTVLNHRCASLKSPNGQWTQFGGKYNWDDRAVICNDPSFHGRGHQGTGVPLSIAPNIDHQQDFVKRDIIDWLNRLRHDVGFDAYRIDYARGFHGRFVGDYIKETKPAFAVGEFWDGLEYDGDYMRPNQDAHRSRIAHWVDQAHKEPKAFDFTTKGQLMQACRTGEFWRLKDGNGKPSGFNGMWPRKAVTFIDNHDTGGDGKDGGQGHWPFPADKVMQGYAYILTHPGMPTVFFNHVFNWKLHEQLKTLIAIRKEMEINVKPVVKIEKADNTMYIARVQREEDSAKQLYVKLGHGTWAPSSERGWELRASGNGYAVWTRDGIPKPKAPEPKESDPEESALRRVVSNVRPFLPVREGEQDIDMPAKEAADAEARRNAPAAAPLSLKIRDAAVHLRMEDSAEPGKRRLIYEYDVDATVADEAEFTVTLSVTRGKETESFVRRL